jgi:hypothetical protein
MASCLKSHPVFETPTASSDPRTSAGQQRPCTGCAVSTGHGRAGCPAPSSRRRVERCAEIAWSPAARAGAGSSTSLPRPGWCRLQERAGRHGRAGRQIKRRLRRQGSGERLWSHIFYRQQPELGSETRTNFERSSSPPAAAAANPSAASGTVSPAKAAPKRWQRRRQGGATSLQCARSVHAERAPEGRGTR